MVAYSILPVLLILLVIIAIAVVAISLSKKNSKQSNQPTQIPYIQGQQPYGVPQQNPYVQPPVQNPYMQAQTPYVPVQNTQQSVQESAKGNDPYDVTQGVFPQQ